MIYFDNASTSFPKPERMVASMHQYLTEFGVSPGRGAHALADRTEELVATTRSKLSEMIGGEKPNHLIFTNNATHALNIVIKGFLKHGDHVLICSYSHNSVIRPVDTLKRKGTITYDVFSIDSQGNVDLEAFKKGFKHNTRLVICSHASNVIGVISPILQLATVCRSLGAAFLLDCTQSLGYAPISLKTMPIDFLAGTGHKTLLGPTGTGFLYVRDPQSLEPLEEGGSGKNYSLSPFHPSQMPYKFEAGTMNAAGIAGLKGALDYISDRSFEAIASQAMGITQYAWDQLREIEEVLLYGTEEMTSKVPIISFNLIGALPNEIAYLYNELYGICLRSGIHCAPLIHKALGTLPTGTLRISVGHFNTYDEVDRFIAATKEIIRRVKRPCYTTLSPQSH